MNRALDQEAQHRLTSLFPAMGPWTFAAMCAGINDIPPPQEPLDAEVAEISARRLTSFVSHYLSTHRTRVDQSLRDSLQAAAFTQLLLARGACAAAATLIDQLSAAGIGATVIKGPAVARHYAVPTLRTYGDVDVVVAADDFLTVLRRMVDDGWQEDPLSRQPWPIFQRYCRESVNLHKPVDRTAVDLHHRPSPWRWTTRLTGSQLVARARTESVFDLLLPCADLADNTLITALQLITDHRNPGSKLLAWRDLAELTRQQPTAVAVRANETALGGILRALLLAMPPALRCDEAVDLLDTHVTHPRRLILLLDAAREGRYARSHMARLPVSNAALYFAGTVWPSGPFLRAEYPHRRRRLLAWWEELAAGVRSRRSPD